LVRREERSHASQGALRCRGCQCRKGDTRDRRGTAGSRPPSTGAEPVLLTEVALWRLILPGRPTMVDQRLRQLAEELEAGLIARREFLRRAAVVTGGTAAGLHVLRAMAHAQPKTKLRVWLFKTYVTACYEILARHVEAWAKERNVEVEFEWATFGDREQKFVAAIEAGNPPDVAEMNYQGPMRYRPALRDVTKLAKEVAAARGGLLAYADRVVQVQGQYFGIAHQAFGGGLHVRKDILAEKGLKMPKVYVPDVIEVAKKYPGKGSLHKELTCVLPRHKTWILSKYYWMTENLTCRTERKGSEPLN
jgi:hypothetical protein